MADKPFFLRDSSHLLFIFKIIVTQQPASAASDAVKLRAQLRMSSFVIARKQGKFWKITEKIFSEEL
jgi:hypothetical protein